MKKGVLMLCAVLSLIFISNFVLAAVPINMPAPELPGSSDFGPFAPLADVVKGMMNGIGATLNYALGGTGFGDIAFAKFLLFILLVIVLYEPSKLIVGKRSNGLAITVSIIVSILGLYLLPKEVIAAILLPYNTLGVVVTTIIPLAALAYFLNTFARDLPAIRKVGWILAAIAFLGLMIFRLGDKSAAQISGVVTAVYGLAFVACFLFFLFDGTITSYLRTIDVKKDKDKVIYINLARKRAELKDLTNLLGGAKPGSHEESVLLDDMNEVQDKINSLYKQIGK